MIMIVTCRVFYYVSSWCGKLGIYKTCLLFIEVMSEMGSMHVNTYVILNLIRILQSTRLTLHHLHVNTQKYAILTCEPSLQAINISIL